MAARHPSRYRRFPRTDKRCVHWKSRVTRVTKHTFCNAVTVTVTVTCHSHSHSHNHCRHSHSHEPFFVFFLLQKNKKMLLILLACLDLRRVSVLYKFLGVGTNIVTKLPLVHPNCCLSINGLRTTGTGPRSAIPECQIHGDAQCGGDPKSVWM